MADAITPKSPEDVLEAVAWAAANGQPLWVAGAGTKDGWGRPGGDAARLDLTALAGVEFYEANELVMAAKAGTRLRDIDDVLSRNRQRLAFEPPDFGPLFGGAPGAGTVGGALACNLAGPRRILIGAARDHFLGFEAVSGRAETFKSGGRVVKNVTGFDLSKLLAGSFGTLAVMTSVTFKVLPAPEKIRTVLLAIDDAASAIAAMSRALGSACEVSAAAHLPGPAAARSEVSYVGESGGGITAIRVEGPGPSVEARCLTLKAMLAEFGETEELHSQNSNILWREIGDVAGLVASPDHQVWRVSVPPTAAPEVAAAILGGLEGEAFFDWGGGLIWLAVAPRDDAGAGVVRGAVAGTGGHATLLRASEAVRRLVPVFEPQNPVAAALSGRIKDSFDPAGVLNPGRMYPPGESGAVS